MRYSNLFGKTKKETAKQAKLKSHQFLLRAGFINQTAAGLYSFLPLGFKVLSKIDAIVKQELAKENVQHLLMPYVSPASLWQETGRYDKMDSVLAKFTSKRGQDLVLSPTHEEIITDLVRKYVQSYKDLPLILNHNQLKFRDEIRAFGGLVRTREFLMQDAYTFDTSAKGLSKSFDAVVRAYKNIFKQLEIEAVEIEADSGTMGGSDSHEFVIIANVGEDLVLQCSDCNYKANVEKAEFEREKINLDEKIEVFKIIDQPEWVCTMQDNVKHYRKPLWRYLKNVVYKDQDENIIIASIRGDQEVNEAKLMQATGVQSIEPATDNDLKNMGTRPGWVHSWGHKNVIYIGDYGLKMVRNFIGGQKEKDTDSVNVNYGRDFEYKLLADIVNAKENDLCAKCKKGKLKEKRGIEIAHAFKLGTCYSNSMNAKYLDKNGKLQLIHMGSYGFGVSRAVAVVAEVHNDDNGIVWPKTVTPYHVHLIVLDTSDGKIFKQAQKLYEDLKSQNIDVLFDERKDVSAGSKFADADLIGIPIRLVVSKKSLKNGGIEFKLRNSGKIEIIKISELEKRIKDFYKI
ncbi:proline--tRNA ligase [Patescibacteria group bacterium]|nr:proline--tRNA ligase [Patescibacteria group bacterium]MCG2701557.1 proline--tRNA ligase [Candidatus Parcubacteria bacterium]MBU4264475.1 proline--tRNA ligase [Patescibacteria group bacterium]MBU4390406.1 proline--tRNA ligase [Patescibacteria group bacterium]MBU4431462.1 proline--tRNA ligase [Patescibacteria group bacterium]